MNPHVNAIANRLSLRPPQRESLEILDRVCEIIPLEKGSDSAAALHAVRSEFPTVTDFERDFPSLCFALATGVGKTRLMGGFISYLYKARGLRHFFVLAPNLTIYNKLIADFTPNTPKYVFQGIADFATNPPEIITGDNYESGRGVREEAALQHTFFPTGDVHINIFNISKINSEVRGGRSPRIKRLSEYIGQSYFDYLAELPDLVLIMDESHRYRALAGVKAINELRPVLGLELTATPQVEHGNHPEPFQNVIYSYPLASAMKDGFVKEPAVATRENFDAGKIEEGELEKIKLEDGVRIHEDTKVHLEVYARENRQPIVKPFMLVVAKDTDHADALMRTVEADAFFNGRYRGKVITVHSNQKGEERDETVEQLMSVEQRDNPTEIVIHVNMLKEGWDVTNLYTIVPLRTANSRTLVEQSIGRGLRLPYGKRVNVPEVDRLTIVSHDKFQEIIDDAGRPDSIIRTGVVIGRDIPLDRPRVVIAEPRIEERLTGIEGTTNGAPSTFATPEARAVARTTLDIIKQFEHLPRAADLNSEQTRQAITDKVTAALVVPQPQLPGLGEPVNTPRIVAETISAYITLSIDIPRIVVQPTGDVTSGFRDFDLDVSSVRYQPIAENILIQHLQNSARYRLSATGNGEREVRLEDYLVRGLIDYDDISYDDHAPLLYKLARQLVTHLRSYLSTDEDVGNVLQYYRQPLVSLIHAQMLDQYVETATGYVANVSKGFVTLRAATYSAPADALPRDFRTVVDDRADIRNMLFTGFQRCLYSMQKFDSDSERRFAVLLENDAEVVKWLKPAKGTFKIYYNGDDAYEPDFVVETQTAKYLCEPKRANEMTDAIVVAKARAAVTWCEYATAHEVENGGKPWSYLLIPHDAIKDNMTLAGMTAAYTYRPRMTD